MKYGTQVFEFIKKNKVGKIGINPKDSYQYIDFSSQEFKRLIQQGLVYDGRKGGLILGKLHHEGGVHMIQQKESKFRYVGEMEGWEYLTSGIIKTEISHKFKLLNEKNPIPKNYKLEKFTIPNSCKVIDTSISEISFILLSQLNHFIINRYATKNNLKEIIELDKINTQ